MEGATGRSMHVLVLCDNAWLYLDDTPYTFSIVDCRNFDIHEQRFGRSGGTFTTISIICYQVA